MGLNTMSNNIWAYDIEVMGGNFFSVTFINVDTEEVKVFYSYESKNCLSDLENFLNQDNLVLVGYNSIDYDGAVIQYALKYKDNPNILKMIFEFSSDLITSDRNDNYQYREYQHPKDVKYSQIDLMKVIAIGSNAPSLKMVGIILHWHKVQDLPYEYDKPISNIEEVNEILKYNENDVRITLSLYKKLLPQLELRKKLGEMYSLDLMSCSDSKIGDKLLEKFYKDKTGISNVYSLKDKVVEYEQFMVGECIFDDVQFQTNYLKRMKNEIANSIARKSADYKISKDIEFGGIIYQIRSGGLHSVDKPGIFRTNDDFTILDYDLNSFYPSMMIKNRIAPLHIGKEFLEILENMTIERVAAKHVDDIKAAGLKISINAIYGKLGFIGSWFKDKKSLLKVTISGQLYLLMLIERFVLAGIEVISANTDGVVCRVKKNQETEYRKICEDFSKEIGIGGEFTEYSIYARKDVNNYISKKPDGKVKHKGDFIPIPEIKKGYAHPIVPVAVNEYLLNGIPVETTIKNHKNILDFCVSQKMDSKFNAEIHEVDEEGNSISFENLQKTNRFYMSTNGKKLIKRNKETGQKIGLFVSNLVTILNDYDESVAIEDYLIDYDFYISEANKMLEGVVDQEYTFQPFIDEPPDYQIPQDAIRREAFFLKFQNIKNLPEKVIDNLFWLEDNFKGGSFFDFMVFAEDNSKVSSKFETFIKLGIFDKFGERLELLEFFEQFTNGKNKYSAKLSDKTKNIRLPLLKDEWIWKKHQPSSLYEKIKLETSVSDIPFNLHPTLHKQYVYVVDIDLKSYHPKIKLHILKTGEEKVLKVKQDIYYEHHFETGDILLAKTFEKKFRKTRGEDGKWVETDNFDWFMTSWYKMKPHDKFIGE